MHNLIDTVNSSILQNLAFLFIFYLFMSSPHYSNDLSINICRNIEPAPTNIQIPSYSVPESKLWKQKMSKKN